MLGSAGECFADVGVRPVGFRSPRSAWSVPLLKALVSRGYRWNAERDRSGWPYRIVPGLVRVGVTTDDWDLSDEASPVSGLMSKWARCVEQAAWCGQDVSIGVHEWLIGRRGEYAAALDGFLAEVRGRAGLKLETLGGLAGV